jgi:large subunit ribosomal protein L24
MSQLTKAPLRSAKHLKKVKEMKQVETAIKWHERARKKRQALKADAWESKQTVLRSLRWEKAQVQDVKRQALKHAREDWKLGPLRPNRAIGDEARTYGAMDQEGMRRPPVPVRVQKNRNEVREKKGKELLYPIVVDDKKYFHIVAGDRVVVINGREKGKIGTVYDVLSESHEVIIKDVNKVCGTTIEIRMPAHPV